MSGSFKNVVDKLMLFFNFVISSDARKMKYTERIMILFLLVLLTGRAKFIEAVLTFEDENFYGYEADRYDWNKHPCNRQCLYGQRTFVCSYLFVVEQYVSLSKACYDCPFNITDCWRPHCIPTDGVVKLIEVANRQLPGPMIEVCENDIIVVDVRNNMLSESTTIHWHGFKQYGTPYMDGVPMVSQCPILPGDTFRYIFRATTTGTFFWHSHIGEQRANGLFGGMVVHSYTNGNFYANEYDFDIHRMVITDWALEIGSEVAIKEYYWLSNQTSTNILINGLGPFRKFQSSKGTFQTPFAVFNVAQGERHRIRLIHAGSGDCPVQVAIDQHKVFVTGLDSNAIRAVEVDVMTIWPGERIDFILIANQAINNYWIRYKGYGQCDVKQTYQMAILHYIGAGTNNPSAPVGYQYPRITGTTKVFNAYNDVAESGVNIKIPNLYGLYPPEKGLPDRVDQQEIFVLGFNPLDNYDFHRKNLYGYQQVQDAFRIGSFQLNNINLKLPQVPLMSQWDMVNPNSFCNSSTIPAACATEQCACTHLINVKLNSVVELVFIDEGRYEPIVNHPMHLHGHFFYVIAMERLNESLTVERFRQLDRQGRIRRNLDRPPMKDTISTPSKGYTIVRFVADNPGYWFFHCHFEDHNNVGMALIFKVGEVEDFPRKPDNFPQCGDFRPNVM